MSSKHSIWTVGHSNHEFEVFVSLLSSQKIEWVVDVRSYPYSRYCPQFDREQLVRSLKESDLDYLFLGEQLGGRPTKDEHYDETGRALYGPMSEEAEFQAAIERLVKGASSHRIAILCSEGDPTDCHRRLLVGRVLAKRGIVLKHLFPDGSVKSEDSVNLGQPIGQSALFEEDESAWKSSQSVSHRQRLSTSSVD